MPNPFDIVYTDIALPKPLARTRIHRKGVQARWGGNLMDSYLHWPEVADFRAIDGKQLLVSPQIDEEGVLRLFLESEATGLIYLQQGYFLLHASAVKIGDKAVIFAGTPGAGKSTTTAAFVKAGHAPLADDMVVIMFENGQPYVVPNGPQIKIWHTTAHGLGFAASDLEPCYEGHNKFYYTFKGPYPTAPVPLAKICLLHRSNRYLNQPHFSAAQVPFEFLKHFPLPHQLLKGEYLQKHFFESLQIAKHAAITRLIRPEGFEALMRFVEGESGYSISLPINRRRGGLGGGVNR